MKIPPDESIEGETALKYPREARMVARMLDYIEAKDYCNAIEILEAVYQENEPTSHAGVFKTMPREDTDIEPFDVVMLIVGAMMPRQFDEDEMERLSR